MGRPGPSGSLEIASSRMGHLWDALSRAYDALGFPQATGHDEEFRQLALARIIEPASKQDSLRVLEETGIAGPSYPALNRRLPAWAQESWRQGLRPPAPRTPGSGRRHWCSTTCRPSTSGPARETDSASQGSPGNAVSSHRSPSACSPARTASRSWSPRSEGNRAETKTMLPVTGKFMAAHQLPDVTVVAGAGMISEANHKAIEAAGLSFILGMKIPDVPCQVAQWRREHPGEDIPDGHMTDRDTSAHPATTGSVTEPEVRQSR
jgi:hypothetical protein